MVVSGVDVMVQAGEVAGRRVNYERLTRMPDGQQKIAAIIALYNGRDFIERSLLSVLSQTRQADEIIVVDDGSTDDGGNFALAVAAGDKRVRVIRKANGGQSSARNLGVINCTSDLIAFLDQDDWWYPQHLERLEMGFSGEGSSKLGWVYSDLDEFDADGKLVTRRMLSTMDTEHPKRSLHACLASDMYVLPSAALIRREAFDSVGGFDERLSGYEDDDLFIRMFREGWDNRFIRKALSGWRIHSGSTSYSPRMAASGMVYAEKLLAAFPDDHSRSRYYRRDLIAPRFLHVALSNYVRALRSGDRRMMQTALQHIDRLRPHLRIRRRMMLAFVRPFMSFQAIGRLGLSVSPFVRGVRHLVH